MKKKKPKKKLFSLLKNNIIYLYLKTCPTVACALISAPADTSILTISKYPQAAIAKGVSPNYSKIKR